MKDTPHLFAAAETYSPGAIEELTAITESLTRTKYSLQVFSETASDAIKAATSTSSDKDARDLLLAFALSIERHAREAATIN